MNQRNLFKIIALPVCLLAFGLTSCEKDEPELNPGGPTEQVLPGTAGEVTEAVTTEGGYALSYRSCIALPEGGSAEVDLTASLPASGTTTEEIVSNWDYAEEAAINSVYSGEFNREENGFIITDSLLVYTVSYGTFELTFEFPYETAQYDGTDVPEYRFEIKDKGGKFELIDSKERDGKAYALREYTHTVEAVFGGKSYEVSKSILLMRELGPANEPYLLSSEIIEVIAPGYSSFNELCYAGILLYRRWSDGVSGEEGAPYMTLASIKPITTEIPEINNYQEELKIIETNEIQTSIERRTSTGKDVFIYDYKRHYVVNFNYFMIEYDVATSIDLSFDDGLVEYDFPNVDIQKYKNDFTFEKEGEVYDDGNGPCQNYHLIHTLTGINESYYTILATTDLIVKVRL